jgi:hypothetical protein
VQAAGAGSATVGIGTKNATQRSQQLAFNWASGGSIDPRLAPAITQGDVIEFFPTDYGMFDYVTEVSSDNLVDIVSSGQGFRTNDVAVRNDASNPDLSSVTSSNANSFANVNLGFTYNYFGQPLTAITLNSAGVLVAESTRSTYLGFLNGVLGSTAAPNNVLAPFWDNLDPTVTGGNVRVLTQGSAGSRRFSAEWRNVAVRDNANADTGGRVSFQTVLKEGTNEVEFIYGSLTGGTGQAQGSSASVGIDSATGVSRYLLRNNSPGPGANIVQTGMSFRMMP